MSRHRGDQVKRQWRILLAMSDCRWHSLAEVWAITPRPRPHKRTIMRDLDVLMDVFAIRQRYVPGEQSGGLYEYRMPHSILRPEARRVAK